MKKINALGIKYPNSKILVENVLKQNMEDEIIINLKKSAEQGLEELSEKYGYNFVIETNGNELVVRMTQKDIEIEKLDVTGQTCPGPVIIVGDKLASMQVGQRVEIDSNMKETLDDLVISAPEMNGVVVEEGETNGNYYVIIEKVETKTVSQGIKRNKVLVVQSNGIGNAERAYATFIFSKAALSMGKEVTIFLLMDGVSIARKGNAEKVKHPAFERLDKLMKPIIEQGAQIYVCELSAEFRGIKQTDLVDGTKLAGAATYITLLSDPSFAVVNF
ncbi:DsrE family protein [Methanobacterium lacus]|uniref:DsrE family protein n=1 Tax=Methanobacterium lacus (strain AL-21) TaxID=877455 RepID=F0T854_METLA|nr:DsrE family protein [Methanobacterium lacus]ADZ09680.1 DsrE family protein [Methanobacterium lacus]